MIHAAIAPAALRAGKVGFDEALALVRDHAPLLPAVRVPLHRALGAVLAADVVAAAAHPRFDMSAMDGFALPSALTATATALSPVRLPIVGASLAGHGPTSAYLDSAYEITTGASIPPGCDAVLVAERARRSADGRSLLVDGSVAPWFNIRRMGEDARVDEPLLGTGARIDAASIGALACYGVAEVMVRAQPGIAILSTGDELASGDAGGRPLVFDSNGPMVAAQACEAGGEVWLAPATADRVEDTAGAIERIVAERRPHVIVSTGGVSVGQRDCVPEALQALGATIWFHGVAMRPGKPVLFATLPDGTLYFGLPGNPVAAYVGFRFFVTAALRAMLGMRRETGQRVDVEVARRPGTTLVLKALAQVEGGRHRIELATGQQSHAMRPLLSANAWLVVRDGVAPEAFSLSCGLEAGNR